MPRGISSYSRSYAYRRLQASRYSRGRSVSRTRKNDAANKAKQTKGTVSRRKADKAAQLQLSKDGKLQASEGEVKVTEKVVLKEDFSDGRVAGKGVSLGNSRFNFRVRGGKLSEKSDAGKGFYSFEVADKSVNATGEKNFTISTDVDANTNSRYNNGAGIVFGHQDKNNYFRASYDDFGTAYARKDGFGGQKGTHRDLRLVQVKDGKEVVLGSVNRVNLGDKFNISVTADDGKVSVAINGKTAISARSADANLGQFGVYTNDNDNGVSYDNVEVKVRRKTVTRNNQDGLSNEKLNELGKQLKAIQSKLGKVSQDTTGNGKALASLKKDFRNVSRGVGVAIRATVATNRNVRANSGKIDQLGKQFASVGNALAAALKDKGGSAEAIKEVKEQTAAVSGAVKRVASQVSKLERKTDRNTAQISNNGRKIDQLGRNTQRQVRRVNRQVAQNGRKVDDLDKNVDQVKQQVQNNGRKIDRNVRQTANNGRKIDRLEQQTRRQVNRVTRQVANNGRKLDNVDRSLDKVDKKVDNNGRKIDALTDVIRNKVVNVDGRVNEQAKKVDELRNEVTTRIHETNSRVGANTQKLDDLAQQQQQIANDVTDRFNSVSSQFDNVGTRFDSVDTQIKQIEGRISDGFDNIQNQIDKLDQTSGTQIGSLKGEFEDLKDSFGQKVDQLNASFGSKIDQLNDGFGQKIDQLTAQHEKEIGAVLEKLEEVTAQLVKLSEQSDQTIRVLDSRLGAIGSKFDAFVSKFDKFSKNQGTSLRNIRLFKNVANRGNGALDRLINAVVGGGKAAGPLQKAQANLQKTAGKLGSTLPKVSGLSALA